MHKGLDLMNEIREKQLTRGIRYLAVLGFFGLIASLSRMFSVGWQDIMYFHIFLYLLVLATVFSSRLLSYLTRAAIIIVLAFLLSLAGLIAWGQVGLGVAALFAFCFVSTMLFGTRAGVISTVVSTITIAIVGAGYVYGFITFSFDLSAYLSSASAWFTVLFGMIMFGGTLVLALATMNNQLIDLIQSLHSQTVELLETNEKLKVALDERNRFEAGLERAKKMELVGAIAGGVAHDLNNILSASINYPELLLMKIPKKSPLREPLEIIMKSGLKAATIVHDLLALARRGVANAEVSNINNIVNEFVASPEFEKIRAYHTDVKLEVRLEENLCNIVGSPFHLMKAITNLVSNAAEAMPNGGKIVIGSKNIKLDGPVLGYEVIPSGDYVLLIISDTGTGISENDKEKIFEPFYTKKVMGKSGTGLGMSVVWHTIKDHKGFINLESTEGVGTTFYLYFPTTDKVLPQKSSLIPISKYSGRGESVLVVDDVEEQREIASRILTTLGYKVETAPSGEKALESMKDHGFDIVILDMIMSPGMDGYKTYREILKLRPRQKAIIVSGYAETDHVVDAIKLGAGSYIKKPYMIEKIGLAVRAELDRTETHNNNYH
ncbi:MAG: response regulator [Deltaproteobacteria bacterium]|nr:response regulator [Deltaproteobacteria bacterium]